MGPHGLAEEGVSRTIAWGALLVGLLGTGCGETCSSSCLKAYDSCDVPTPGQLTEDRIDQCIDECGSALRVVGDIGSYSPLASGTVDQVMLENERQAAAWMDCIAESDCTQLRARRCSPL